jgi:hypothetical protein
MTPSTRLTSPATPLILPGQGQIMGGRQHVPARSACLSAVGVEIFRQPSIDPPFLWSEHFYWGLLDAAEFLEPGL